MEYKPPRVPNKHAVWDDRELSEYTDDALNHAIYSIQQEINKRAYIKFEDAIGYTVHVYGAEKGLELIANWYRDLVRSHTRDS